MGQVTTLHIILTLTHVKLIFAQRHFIEDFYYWNSSDPHRAPWLKVCGGDKQYEILPGAWCSKGVHFPNGFVPNCICPFGLWIVKTKVCDIHTHFLLGDARHDICMMVDFKIESLLYLGDPDNVYSSKAYVAPVHLNVFYEIPMNGSFTPVLDLINPMIIYLFPINNRSIETDNGNCFPIIQHNPAKAPVHIWSSGLGPSRYRIVDECQTPLNFGFDDIIGPNMVFVRSNLINVIPVPKLHHCSHSQISQCNQYTTSTTVRPHKNISQLHTPFQHQTLYYNLANVSPKDVEQKWNTIPKDPFSSVEVLPPEEGNFSKFYSSQIVHVELPLMISSKAFKPLTQYSSHDYNLDKQKGADDSEVDSKEESDENYDIFYDITKDIIQKDHHLKKNVLDKFMSQRMMSSSAHKYARTFRQFQVHDRTLNENDDVYEEENENVYSDYDMDMDFHHNHQVKQARYEIDTHSVQEDESENQQYDYSNTPGNIDNGTDSRNRETSPDEPRIKRNGNFFVGENSEAEENYPVISDKNLQSHTNIDKHSEGHSILKDEQENSSYLKISQENDISNTCRGQLDPPKCVESIPLKLQENNEVISQKDSNLNLNDNRFYDGYFKDALTNFDKMLISQNITNFAPMLEQAVDFMLDSCQVPEDFVSKSSLESAIHILLALLSGNKTIHEFLDVFRTNMSDAGILRNECGNPGTVDFLFNAKCPVNITCTRFTSWDNQVTKLVSSYQPTLQSETILFASLEAVQKWLKFMCQRNAENQIYKFSNDIEKIYTTISNAESKLYISKFSEMILQSYLNISNVQTFLLLLEKCVSAAETIQEHTNIMPLVNHLSPKNFSDTTRAHKKTQRARRSATKPMLVFDGKAICMDSYWDGLNKSFQTRSNELCSHHKEE